MNTRAFLMLALLVLGVSPLLQAEEMEYWDEPILLRPSPAMQVEEMRVPGRITSVTVHSREGFSYKLIQAGGNGEFEPVQTTTTRASFTAPMKIPTWTIWRW